MAAVSTFTKQFYQSNSRACKTRYPIVWEAILGSLITKCSSTMHVLRSYATLNFCPRKYFHFRLGDANTTMGTLALFVGVNLYNFTWRCWQFNSAQAETGDAPYCTDGAIDVPLDVTHSNGGMPSSPKRLEQSKTSNNKSHIKYVFRFALQSLNVCSPSRRKTSEIYSERMHLSQPN